MTWLQEVQSEMARARSLHPSNHLLLSAMTEEAGEVVKAVLDHMAGKGTLAEVRTELIQAAAMIGRLLEEGDPVHLLNPPIHAAVRHCSHVDETEAPAPKPCQHEYDWIKGQDELVCVKCGEEAEDHPHPAPKPCTHERNDWDPSGNDFICSDCGLWSYDDGITWEPKRPAPARIEDDAYRDGYRTGKDHAALELQSEVARLKAQLERLLSLVSDDSLAVTFQSIGQYRTFLKSEIRAALAKVRE